MRAKLLQGKARENCEEGERGKSSRVMTNEIFEVQLKSSNKNVLKINSDFLSLTDGPFGGKDKVK